MNMKFLLTLSFLMTLISCGKSPINTPPEKGKPTILVSLAPHQFLIEKIAGDTFTVRTIVPLGSNPHAYEPTIRHIKAISEGVIWFRIGESFEKQVLPVLKQNKPDLVDEDLRQSVSLLHNSGCHCHHEEILEDRHIWLSPKMLIEQTKAIVAALSHRFPESKDLFEQNGKSLIQDLENLDLEIKAILKNTKRKSFLVSHPAFAYFCKEYGLTQLSIELGGKDPTSKHLTQIMQEVVDSQTKLAISMPQHSNKGLEVVAEKLKLNVSMVDPYALNYSETMLKLAHLVADNE
jgi:zinc transport system substrate-binding protein